MNGAAQGEDPTLYYALRCRGRASVQVDGLGEEDATRTACEVVGGKFCTNVCSVESKKSGDAGLRNKFLQECKNKYGSDDLELNAYAFVTKEMASTQIECREQEELVH